MAMGHGLAGLGMWSCDLIDYPLSSNPLSKIYWDQIAAYAKGSYNFYRNHKN
jgi:hypothetical protein